MFKIAFTELKASALHWLHTESETLLEEFGCMIKWKICPKEKLTYTGDEAQ